MVFFWRRVVSTIALRNQLHPVINNKNLSLMQIKNGTKVIYEPMRWWTGWSPQWIQRLRLPANNETQYTSVILHFRCRILLYTELLYWAKFSIVQYSCFSIVQYFMVLGVEQDDTEHSPVRSVFFLLSFNLRCRILNSANVTIQRGRCTL